MYFESVAAYAFGPFADQSLQFAPGLTVVYGPNEAGKSTWHAALYAGLCGMRRGGGLRTEDREFARRHRPWDGGGWEVGAVIALEAGRRVELRHELIERVACRATDADLGRDCSAEIVSDGAPDGARWLGLDRRSFLATACVRQAEVLGVHQDPGLLQEHLQRAAATSGTDATAAQALERIRQFQSVYVGRDVATSARPLRQASERLEAARQALDRARGVYHAYLELAAQAEQREQEATAAEQKLRLARARWAAREAEAWARRLERARALAQRHPGGPPGGAAAEDELAQAVAAALRAWEARPAVPTLSGQTASELQRQLEALPAPPEGDLYRVDSRQLTVERMPADCELSTVDCGLDLEPHPEVAEAHEALRDAVRAVEHHADDRPPEPSAPETGGASEQELRPLARDLAAPQPRLEPALEARRDRARQRVAALARQQGGRWRLLAAGALAATGLAMIALSLPLPGVVLLLCGGVVLGWALAQGGAAARLRALEELRAAEEALGAARHDADQTVRRRESARARATALGLPAEAEALEQLAEALAAAAQARRDLARWARKGEELADLHRAAEARLAAALRGRGVEVGASLAQALAAYEAACRQRARLAAEAARRSALERQLADRLKAEELAADAVRRRVQAEQELRQAAARCGLAGERDEVLAEALRDWQRRRAQELAALDAARQEWAELESLLGGGTLADLEAQAGRRRDHAARLGAGLDAEAVRAVALGQEPEAQLQRLEEAAREAAKAWDQVRGQVDERARALPSVAEAEEALAGAQAELARVRQLDRTLTLARQFLERAQERVHRDVAPLLAASVRRWLPQVTAHRYLDVRVDPQTLNVQVCGEGGRWREASLLSHGTAEQVYLLLRAAMAQHLTRPGEVCPLLLDDVTTQCDAERTEAVLRALHALSQERQVILFTQEPAVLSWAQAHLQPPRDRVERLDPQGVAV